jgi:hypothetical protein
VQAGASVKDCPSDYVGSTSGVPKTAADLIAPPNSAALGQLLTIVWLASKESWSEDLLAGAGNVFGGIFKLTHRRRVLLGIVLTF